MRAELPHSITTRPSLNPISLTTLTRGDHILEASSTADAISIGRKYDDEPLSLHEELMISIPTDDIPSIDTN